MGALFVLLYRQSRQATRCPNIWGHLGTAGERGAGRLLDGVSGVGYNDPHIWRYGAIGCALCALQGWARLASA